MRLARQLAPGKSLAILALVSLALTTSCAVTKSENDDTTNTFLSVNETSSEIFSDVCILNDVFFCTIINDNAEVEMIAQPKDQAQLQSSVQDIVIERYRVTYIRSDGRNTPGVDVPFPFDGVANFRVPVDGNSVTRGFMIVRHQAKAESPLSELAGGGGALILSVIARVEFFGRDIAGRQITTTAFYNISFGDFPDPDEA